VPTIYWSKYGGGMSPPFITIGREINTMGLCGVFPHNMVTSIAFSKFYVNLRTCLYVDLKAVFYKQFIVAGYVL
jgi:hypothetical protein